jgi:hypothetical protein
MHIAMYEQYLSMSAVPAGAYFCRIQTNHENHLGLSIHFSGCLRQAENQLMNHIHDLKK